MTEPERVAAIDRVLRAVDRAVWVITACDRERRGGLVATFVVSLSIDREAPLLGVSINKHHATHDLIQRSGGFVAHLLRVDQIELAWRFGLSSSAEHDKLAGLASESVIDSLAPRLIDCFGWVAGRCLGSVDLAGRTLFVAELTAGDLIGSGAPLTEQQLIGAANDEQRAVLKSQRDADVERGRPLVSAWRLAMMSARGAGAEVTSDGRDDPRP